MTTHQERWARIREALSANPDHFDMDFWHRKLTEESPYVYAKDLNAITPDDPYQCGTTCCLAGWAVALFKDEIAGPAVYHPEIEVAEFLGVSSRVFFDEYWRLLDEDRYGPLVEAGRIIHDMDIDDQDEIRRIQLEAVLKFAEQEAGLGSTV